MAEERKRIPAEKYNQDNAPLQRVKANPGKAIYEYVDGNGKTQKVNMFEKVQSYAAQVDYKSMIEKGYDIAEKEGGNYGGIADYTGVQGDTTDIIELINSINSLSEEQIAYLLQQSQEGTAQTTQEGQRTTTTTEESGEGTSASGDGTTTTTEGGAK